ncbi:hypothetical protein SUDANB66_06612 (plasmid) [Streptomyces sp. SudanB66_2053]
MKAFDLAVGLRPPGPVSAWADPQFVRCRAKCSWCRPRCIGLGLGGIEVGEPPHCQPGQISNLAAHVSGRRQRQSPNPDRLVDHHEHGPVLGLQLAEHFASSGSLVGSRLSRPCSYGRFDGNGVVFALADVQAEEEADVAGVDHVRLSVVLARPSHGTHRSPHAPWGLATEPFRRARTVHVASRLRREAVQQISKQGAPGPERRHGVNELRPRDPARTCICRAVGGQRNADPQGRCRVANPRRALCGNHDIAGCRVWSSRGVC